MRICRSAFLRLFFARNFLFKWKAFQLAIPLILVVFFYIYLQEKFTKDALISMSLESGRVDELVKPENDTLILNGLMSGNRSMLASKNPFIVIGVTSLPGNAFRRDIIRNTWALKAYENYGATVVFFLGKPSSQQEMTALTQEAEQYGDLIVDDFKESYYALSIQTLRLLKYFKFHHSKAKFLVKTDDDVFVNVRNLVHYCYKQNHDFESRFQQAQEDLEGKDNRNGGHVYPEPFYFIAGVIHYDRGPHTWDAFSKWYVPASVWHSLYQHVAKDKSLTIDNGESKSVKISENMYPPYAEGNFYVMSDDAVVDILEASRKVQLYHLEDVFVTGILATWILDIEKENMPFVSSASNFLPGLSYWWYTKFTPPEDLIAFHCDNHVGLIKTIYQDSLKFYT